MEKLISFLGILLMFTSCSGQEESSNDKSKLKDTIPIPDFLKIVEPVVEDPYFIVTRDTISNEGPKSITRNLLQDRNGIYWFATWQGIMSYDGKIFTNHTLKAGLRKFHVFSVLEDRKGNLWFGTIRGGVFRYDGNAFTLFTTKDGLVDDIIGCMMEDDAGNIWFGTDEGVSRYDGNSFTNYTIEDGLSANSVNWIMQDKTGKIWFATRGGTSDVSYYDGHSFTLFNAPDGKNFWNIRSIIEDKNGNILIGGQSGLFRYDGKSVTELSSNFIGYMVEDSTGNLWLSEGKVGGPVMTVTRYDGKSFTPLKDEGQAFGIMQDKNGHILVGTDNGVRRFDGKLWHLL